MPEASAIKEMFEGVAPRYDFLNRVLSLGIDRGWRRRVVESLELRPEHRVLDLCCGTGDLALEIARSSPLHRLRLHLEHAHPGPGKSEIQQPSHRRRLRRCPRASVR